MYNREIKFRAFNTIGKEMIDLKKITPFALCEGMSGEDGLYLPFTKEWPIMQYTGLKDREGKEIYEGDLVRMLYTDWGSKPESDTRTLEQYLIDISFIGEVVFYCDRWCIASKSNKYGDVGFSSIFPGEHGRITVIGNIYENPQLIEK